MRFATHLLLWQFACVIAIVAVCTGVFTWLGVQQLRAEAESSALGIARTVATDTDVRRAVEAISAEESVPSAEDLRTGELAALARDVEDTTGALFVVITDDRGIRLAHPDPDRLGEVVSTSFEDALAGRETVSWAEGTLGESARAKVPVFAPGTREPVGEVSVGFARTSVFDDLPPLLIGVAVAATAALLIGLIVSALIRRRLERLTLGVQPEELAALVQNQAAVLDGVGDGVLAYAPGGVVRVANASAARLLGVSDLVGRKIDDLDLPEDVRAALSEPIDGGRAGSPLIVDDRVLFVDTRPVSRAGRDLGAVAVIRDRTDVLQLSERLESVSTMTTALRAQRHEFSNRLHVAAGLIDADRIDEARDYLGEALALPADAQDATVALTEPFLRSLIEAKTIEAAERGVALEVEEGTLVLGRVAAAEDVATVLANLVDNAVRAAVQAPPPRRVGLEILDEADTLVITVSDSGSGVSDPGALFERDPGVPEPEPDAVHGRGIGLPLVRRIARRLGGEVWLVDAGGPGSGAVFSARLPHTMEGRAAAPVADEEER
jgi:two-component system CitB family sensor kinase